MAEVFEEAEVSMDDQRLGVLWYISAVASFCHSYWAPACMSVLEGRAAVPSVHALALHPVLNDVKLVYDSMAAHEHDPDMLAMHCMILHHIASSNEGKWAIRASGGIDRVNRVKAKFPDHHRCQVEGSRALYLLQ